MAKQEHKKDQKVEGLMVKSLDDDKLVAAIKCGIADLCRLINEADRRDIQVNFNIAKPVDAPKGELKVTQCDISRKL